MERHARRALWFPTLFAIRLRKGWGTEHRGTEHRGTEFCGTEVCATERLFLVGGKLDETGWLPQSIDTLSWWRTSAPRTQKITSLAMLQA